MKPIDLRNETWASLQARVSGQRLAVLNAWRQFGDGTTEQLAALSGISILTVRPRTTELVDLGLVELVGRVATGGVYSAISEEKAIEQFERHKREALTPQLPLKICA